jgi:glycosyltransferase involved in cell wall biosynthesis
MKILQLCKKFPYPLKDGESVAVTQLAKALHELGAEVTLLTMNTSKHPVEMESLPASFRCIYQAIYEVPVFNHITILGALRNLFEKESYHISRFISKDYEQKIISILKKESFDVVQLEMIHLAPYIPIIKKYSNAKIVCRAHNVEHEIWKRVADITKNPFKKYYLRWLTGKLRRFEIENLANYDALLPITERDGRIFRLLGYRGQMLPTPVGMDSCRFLMPPISMNGHLSLGFIGSLDWTPNIEGLKWFLENVWGQFLKDKSQFKLHIAGRNAPDWLLKLNVDNLKVHGEIADAHRFTAQHPVMIVPLFSGSGIRVKILESMMLGRVVITTKIGMEGIPAIDGESVLIANTAAEFIEKIRFCRRNAEKMAEIGAAARKLMLQQFDNLTIAARVLDFYDNLNLKNEKLKTL